MEVWWAEEGAEVVVTGAGPPGGRMVYSHVCPSGTDPSVVGPSHVLFMLKKKKKTRVNVSSDNDCKGTKIGKK